MMEPGAGNYSFASQPQAVPSRSKFREPRLGADGRMAINIMWYLALSPWTARTNAARACTSAKPARTQTREIGQIDRQR